MTLQFSKSLQCYPGLHHSFDSTWVPTRSLFVTSVVEGTSLCGCVILDELLGMLESCDDGCFLWSVSAIWLQWVYPSFCLLQAPLFCCWGREAPSWVKFCCRMEVRGSSVCHLVGGWEYPELSNQLPWGRSLRDAGFSCFSTTVCRIGSLLFRVTFCWRWRARRHQACRWCW